MTRIMMLALGLALLAGPAPAQIDCGPGGNDCTTTVYGLGDLPEFRKDEIPINQFRWSDPSAFGTNLDGASYLHQRGSLNGLDTASCGPERNFSPIPGRIVLREENDCVPTATGPSCVGGANDGLPCSQQKDPDACPGGGVCSPVGACLAEIPISDGGVSDPALTSENYVFNLAGGVIPTFGEWQLSAATGNTWGGSGVDGSTCTGGPNKFQPCASDTDCPDGSCLPCIEKNIRRKPSMAARYLLPATHAEYDGSGNQTYLRWDHHTVDPGDDSVAANNDTGFRLSNDDARVCCAEFNPTNNQACSLVLGGPQPVYPDIIEWNCRLGAGVWINEANQQPDWIFQGGANGAALGRFYSDPSYVPPGQLTGVCTNNRLAGCYSPDINALCTGPGDLDGDAVGCCTGDGTGTCGNANECPGDTCDFTQPGHRVQSRCKEDANGDLRPECCSANLYVVRGKPVEDCSLMHRLEVNGDPGFDCGVINYGIEHRDDANCDGVADNADLCPWVIEWDETADTDGDCPGPDCRGNECECGDHTGDGNNNVADILSVNAAIFGGALNRLCDADNSVVAGTGNVDPVGCNVSDILRINQDIFESGATTCRQVQPGTCGDGIVDPAFLEECDNGLANNDNGPCSTICRLVP